MNVFGKIKFQVRELFGHNKSGIRILAKWSGWRSLLVHRDSKVCIEGFPRSANTYAVIAFQVAQGDPGYHMAHHSHLAGNVLLAVDYEVPCAVLVRAPEEAALSFKLYSPYLSMGQCLRAYSRFHRALLPVCGKVVVVRFEEIVSDFNVMIDRMNTKYQCQFKRLSSKVEAGEQMGKRLKALEQRGSVKNEKVNSDHGVVQSEERRKKKRELARVFEMPEIRGLLKEAKRSYEEFLDAAGLEGIGRHAGKRRNEMVDPGEIS